MDRKLNLLFEVSILNSVNDKDASRTGIYFVAYNVLNELLKSDKFNVYLYGVKDENKECIRKRFVGASFNFFKNNFADKIGDNITLRMARLEFKLRSSIENKKRFSVVKYFIKIGLFKIKYLIVKNSMTDYKNIDAYLSPYKKIIDPVRQNSKIKKYTILYDCIPFVFKEYFNDGLAGWFPQMIKTMNSNDYYFVISDFTKKDFIKYVPQIDPEKVIVTPLACADNFVPCKDDSKLSEIKKKYNIPLNKKYVFSLCSLEPRKNVIRAVKTFIEFIKKNNIDDLVFVLGGGHWVKFLGILEKEISDIDEYKNKIIRAGYIDDEDVATLYSNSEWLVYTSQYEGFGLPPLEAMSCGCPVITSNNTSLPEVVGDAGIMINWDSDDEHIKAYETYYFDEKIRQENIRKGLDRAKLFSWKKCVDIMIEDILK